MIHLVNFSPCGKGFTQFKNQFAKFYQNTNIRTQPEKTASCGYYCLYLLIKDVKLKVWKNYFRYEVIGIGCKLC